MPGFRTSPNIDRIWHGALFAAYDAPLRPGASRLDNFAAQPPARSKRVPGNLLVGSLSGKSFESGDATSHASESP